MTNFPDKKFWTAFEAKMLAFYNARVLAKSTTPLEDTEDEFGESAGWCRGAAILIDVRGEKWSIGEYDGGSEDFSVDIIQDKTGNCYTLKLHGYYSKSGRFEMTITQPISRAIDTFMAALVYEYVKSQDIYKSIEFSQKCTTNVVQKPGVALISKNI